MKSHKRCHNCQAKQGQPCHKAQERIRAIQISQSGGKMDDSAIGCDFFINSKEYNYSFHAMLKDLHGAPIPDREICKLLMITQAELNATFESAINKLKAIKDGSLIQEIKDLVGEMSDPNDNTIYMPDDLHMMQSAQDLEDKKQVEKDLEPKKRGPKKKIEGMGMPVHHSGKRTDLYFRSKKSMDHIDEDRKKMRKKNED